MVLFPYVICLDKNKQWRQGIFSDLNKNASGVYVYFNPTVKVTRHVLAYGLFDLAVEVSIVQSTDYVQALLYMINNIMSH